jgi:hypothetical protein
MHITVVNPEFEIVAVGETEATSSADTHTVRAPRLETLDGKTVYLVDTGFGGSYKFMQQLQKWFDEHMPSVVTIRKRKPGNVFADDTDELWVEIKQRGDAAVIGVGG